MAAAKLDLIIEQGATFWHRLTWKDSRQDPIDLTGYSARMQIRSKVRTGEVLIELTTENGRIALGGIYGTIDLQIEAATTAAITWSKGVYDLELESREGFVKRLVKGNVSVDPEVTK